MCLNLKVVLIWLGLLLSTNTELRFCFKGPHKVQETECPGGILFKTPVELSCIDFRKVIGKTTRAAYSTNLCSPGITQYKANTNSLIIQMINISLDNESTGRTAMSSPTYEGCTPECLSTVEQSFHKKIIYSEPEFYDGIPMDIKWTMRNLDFCAQAASRVSPYQERLDRPFSNPVFKTAPIVSTTEVPMGESQTPLVVGWQETEAKYWERYEAKGGFKGVLREFGYCAQTSAEAEKYIRKLKSKCSTV